MHGERNKKSPGTCELLLLLMQKHNSRAADDATSRERVVVLSSHSALSIEQFSSLEHVLQCFDPSLRATAPCKRLVNFSL